MENHKIITMVLAADIFGYNKLIDSIKDTWAKYLPSGYKVLYYYGYRDGYPRPPVNQVQQIGDDVICGLEENVPNINVKTYLAFKHVYDNYRFDYIFRCCAGSYLHLDNIDRYLVATKPSKTNFYCGVVGSVGSHNFASGSGFFISRDLVKVLIDCPASFTCHSCDDVAIGVYLTGLGIHICPGERQDISDVNVINRDHYHFHFRHNVPMMYAIHKALER